MPGIRRALALAATLVLLTVGVAPPTAGQRRVRSTEQPKKPAAATVIDTWPRFSRRYYSGRQIPD